MGGNSVLIGLTGGRVRKAVANLGRLQRIGGRGGRRPAGGNRCEDLHRQRDQNDRKEFLQLPPHGESNQDAPPIIVGLSSRDGLLAKRSLSARNWKDFCTRILFVRELTGYRDNLTILPQ